MKWILRIAGGLVALLALAVGAVLVKVYALSPVVRPAPQVTVVSTPERVARGKYLAESVANCISCHSPADSSQPGNPVTPGKEYTGHDFSVEMVGFPGAIRAPNLTSDQETGIGAMTDGELLRALREGIGRDGHALIMMPSKDFAAAMSDDDAKAIVAFLRSLPPVRSPVGPTVLGFPLNVLVRLEPQPLEKPAPPMPADPLERGKRLMTLAHCSGCHSTHDEHHQDVAGHYLAGGDRFPLPGNGAAFAANLTQDPATGLGAYSDDDLRHAIFEGKSRSGRALYFMPWTIFRSMNDEDKQALLTALKTVPPVSHPVPPFVAPSTTTAAR